MENVPVCGICVREFDGGVKKGFGKTEALPREENSLSIIDVRLCIYSTRAYVCLT